MVDFLNVYWYNTIDSFTGEPFGGAYSWIVLYYIYGYKLSIEFCHDNCWRVIDFIPYVLL